MTILPAQVDLRLEIEGIDERYNLGAVTMDFAINQIPRAACQIPLGRDAYTGTVDLIHKTARKIKRLAKAKIYQQIDGQYDEKNRWPDKEILVFEGRVIGPGFVMGGDQASYSLTLAHWLVDLNFSSTMSDISHPSNPAELTWQAIRGSPLPFAGILPVNMTIWTAIAGLSNTLTQIKASEDIWANGMKTILCNLATQKHVRLKTAFNECDANHPGENRQALAALSRIEGPNPLCSLDYSCYTPKLKLDVESIPSLVISAIFRGLVDETVLSYIGNTFWSTIINSYAPSVSCAVVPLVNTALFVPVTPGLKDTYCKVIGANDYDASKFVFPNPMPTRALGVLSRAGGRTNILAGNDAKLVGIGGCFMPEDIEPLGTIRIIRPPRWLNNLPSADYSGVRTTGVKAKLAVNSATTPQAAAVAGVKGDKDGRDDETRAALHTELYRSYARYVYVSEALRGRVGMLSGKLRYDIAPGSNVLIEAREEPFIGADDQLVNSLIGTVTKVTHSISAEGPNAMTGFEFAYLRSTEENKLDAYSVDRHPLFAESFLGAPLVDDLQFGSCCED